MGIEETDLTVEQVAKALQVHIETVRRWLRDNRLPGAYKTPGGRSWRIPRSDVEALKGRPNP